MASRSCWRPFSCSSLSFFMVLSPCGAPAATQKFRVIRLYEPARGARKHKAGRFLRRGRRSEEHTSELQSRPHLVCRLLLEKKKEHIVADPDGRASQRDREGSRHRLRPAPV